MKKILIQLTALVLFISVTFSYTAFANSASALITAVTESDTAKISALLDSGIDVNMKDEQGNTALTQAAVMQNKDITKLLLERGANPEIENHDHVTALEMIIPGGYIDIAALLIDKTKDPQILLRSAQMAAFSGQPKILQLLLDKGIDVNQYDEHGQNLLMAAARNDKADIVWILINKGALVDEENKEGETALLTAIKSGHPKTVRALLERGASTTLADKDGQTPLAYVQKHLDEWRHSKARTPQENLQAENFMQVASLIDGETPVEKPSPSAGKPPVYVPQDLIDKAAKGTVSQKAALGRLYYYGLKNVPQNFQEAYYWFSICNYELQDMGEYDPLALQKKIEKLKEQPMQNGVAPDSRAIAEIFNAPNTRKMCSTFLSTLNSKLPAADIMAVAPRIDAWKKEHPFASSIAEQNTRDLQEKPKDQTWGIPKKTSMDDLLLHANRGDKASQFQLGACYAAEWQCTPLLDDVQRKYDYQAKQELAQEGQQSMTIFGLDLRQEHTEKALYWIDKSSDYWMNDNTLRSLSSYYPATHLLLSAYMGITQSKIISPDEKKACSLILHLQNQGDRFLYTLMPQASWNSENGKAVENYAWQAVAYHATFPDKEFSYRPANGDRNLTGADLAAAKARAAEYIDKYLVKHAPLCSLDSLK